MSNGMAGSVNRIISTFLGLLEAKTLRLATSLLQSKFLKRQPVFVYAKRQKSGFYRGL